MTSWYTPPTVPDRYSALPDNLDDLPRFYPIIVGDTHYGHGNWEHELVIYDSDRDMMCRISFGSTSNDAIALADSLNHTITTPDPGYGEWHSCADKIITFGIVT